MKTIEINNFTEINLSETTLYQLFSTDDNRNIKVITSVS